jgi:hypothetical protein
MGPSYGVISNLAEVMASCRLKSSYEYRCAAEQYHNRNQYFVGPSMNGDIKL